MDRWERKIRKLNFRLTNRKFLLYIKQAEGVKKKPLYHNLIILFFLFFLSACAKDFQLKKKEEFQVLRNRIEEYWGFIIKGEIEKAYILEHPKYREEISLLKYLNRFKVVKYENFEIMDIKIEANRAEAEIEITHRYMVKHFIDKNIKKKIIDRWVKTKGFWFHFPEGFDIIKE